MIVDSLTATFIAKHGRQPRLFRAPGRINLISEHTDYNDGFVLPASIQFATYVAGAARDDRQIRGASMNFEREFEFGLDDPIAEKEKTWVKYVQGVASILEREGYALTGADILIESDVPVGAGLSSSAALEVATAFALASLSGHIIDGMKLAKIGQTAEHEFAGVRSGIMDQFVSVFGQANHALFLDCRSFEWSPVPVSSGQFVICNTKTKHDLADGEYNKRRAECEAAARFFEKPSLREVTLEEFESRSHDMVEVGRKRARHIITENQRVINAVEALRGQDMAMMGRLINESHDSLRDDFEVSCPELDIMVDLARSQDCVLGARMMGGGFGGCTINLIENGAPDDFMARMADGYRQETGIWPDIYKCEIGNGVSEIETGDNMV